MSVAFPLFAETSLRLQAGSRPGGRGTFIETRAAGFLCIAMARIRARGLLTLRSKVTQTPKEPKERRAGFVGPALRYGHAALLGLSGVRANSLRSNMRAPCSAQPCATRLLITAGGAKYQAQIQQGRAMARPCGVRLFDPRVPLCMCRGAEIGPDEGLRMFEPAGRVCADPGPVEHRRLPRRSRGHRHQGRLFFGDFLLAKQKKVTALPGAHPGMQPREGCNQKEMSPTC
jgi:hypothetical protein